MKKILAFVAFAAISVSSLFADKRTVNGFSFAFTSEKGHWANPEEENPEFFDVKVKNIDFGYSCMTVHDSGFSFIFETDIGSSKTKFVDGDKEHEPCEGKKGLDLKLKFGWGGSPIHTDNIILSIHGFFGFDTRVNTSETPVGNNLVSATLNETLVNVNYMVGADAKFVCKFTNHFGLFAGLDFYVPVFGIASDAYSYSAKVGNYGKDFEDDRCNYLSVWGFAITPRIGICFVL